MLGGSEKPRRSQNLNQQAAQSPLDQVYQQYGGHGAEIQSFENWVDFARRFPQQVSQRTQNRLRYRDQKHGNPGYDGMRLASQRLQNHRQDDSGQDRQAQEKQEPIYYLDDLDQWIPPYSCPSLMDF